MTFEGAIRDQEVGGSPPQDVADPPLAARQKDWRVRQAVWRKNPRPDQSPRRSYGISSERILASV